jgi:hypothetical protein
MSIFKELKADDVNTTNSFLNQVVDILNEDIRNDSSRRKYQVFVTGGIGPGVTSSLYQTVYDQDFSLHSSNAIFDVTFGIRPTSTLSEDVRESVDGSGKEIFPSNTLMMREKLDIYRQFSQVLLGDSTASFKIKSGSIGDTTKDIDCALFLSVKRLFTRDQIKPQTFLTKMFTTASSMYQGSLSLSLPEDLYTPFEGFNSNTSKPEFNQGGGFNGYVYDDQDWKENLFFSSGTNEKIFTDVSQTIRSFESGGRYSDVIELTTSNVVGKIFYDRGVVVLDMERVFFGDQLVSGTIDSANHFSGEFALGSVDESESGSQFDNPFQTRFIPDFVVSSSIDNVIDHVCKTRFLLDGNTAISFQNITNINSTLYFCRAAPEEFNYSGNPTFVDSSNKITTIEPNAQDTQRSFTFVTSIGLYDGNDKLLAVAKLSRPVEKSREKDLTFRVRLDF